MGRKTVAVLDFRSSREIADVRRILEKSGQRGRVVPPDWMGKRSSFRSLTIYDDGRCELREASAASLAKRMKKRLTGGKANAG